MRAVASKFRLMGRAERTRAAVEAGSVPLLEHGRHPTLTAAHTIGYKRGALVRDVVFMAFARCSVTPAIRKTEKLRRTNTCEEAVGQHMAALRLAMPHNPKHVLARPCLRSQRHQRIPANRDQWPL